MLNIAISLLYSIRNTFCMKWDMDWKNDVYLGQLCELTWRYEERYECYKRALDKLDNPPDSLLLLLSNCNSMPGIPSISEEESETYLKQAIAKRLTYEAAFSMRSVFAQKGDEEKEQYWNRLCDELEKKNIHIETIQPDILS